MKVEKFEDFICWQKARALTNCIYDLTRLPSFAKDWDLTRQICRAATSAMSNVAEGFDRWSRKEFVRFLDIAKGSAGEVRSQLYIVLDQRFITSEQFELAKAAAMEVTKTMGGLIGYLEEKSKTYAVRETTVNDDNALDLPTDFCNHRGT